MATKSILKNITVRTDDSCRKLLSALDSAKSSPHKDISISKDCSVVVDRDEIRNLFRK